MKEDKLRGVCQCGKEYAFSPEKTGKKLKCPGCGEIFVATPAGNAESDVSATQESGAMQSEKIAVSCQCGKEYRFPVEKLGKKFKCSACGEMFLATAPTLDTPPAQQEVVRQELVGASSTAQAPASAPIFQKATPAVHLLTEGEEIAIDDSFAPVNPDELLASLNTGKFSCMLGVSTVAHVIIILLTSIPFLMICYEHSTLYPKPIIAAKEKEEKEKAAREERAQRMAKLDAERKKKEEENEKVKKSEPDKSKGGSADANKPNGAQVGEGKKELSEVEKRVAETSNERPKSSSVSLDDPDF